MATLELIEAAGLLSFDAAHGWPPTFTHYKAAQLQTWRKGMERKAHRDEVRTWTKLIVLALASGELAHTTTKETVQDDDSLFQPIPVHGSADWIRRDGFYFADGKARLRTTPRDVTCHHINAPDFAAWLAGQGMEPSPHIAAWFKAQNAGGAGAAAETVADRNARWLLVWDQISTTHGPGSQAEAMRKIATAESVKEDTVKAALYSAEKARKASYRNGGVTPIKPGKNSASNMFSGLLPKARTKR